MSKKAEIDGSRDKNEHIEVFVRVRPLNANERKQFSPSVVEVNSDKKGINVKEKVNDKIINKTYSFDRVFGPDSTQVDVYKVVVLPLIKEVFMGYNCTIFAYGQTSTGKTYTMEGERSNSGCSWEKDPSAGIIPRALHQLFEELKNANVEFTVLVSFLELYNEELFDLLSPADDISKLKLYEDAARKGSVLIQGLEEVAVNSKSEVYSILSKGTARRQTAATLMNATSSRSHTVFSATIHMKEITIDGEELLKTGKLNLVDLAGSENIGRSGAVDKRAREAGSINQSLLTLGRVITALVEKAPHIPYRESKLTRLLQDSLGGHTKTSIIATISPAQCNIDESLSTLDYAHRAKNITNRPEVNQKMTRQALIKEYTEEIERLRRDLMATKEKRGICIGEEVFVGLQNEMAFKSEEVKEMQAQIEMLKEQIEKANRLFEETKGELEIRNEELDLQQKILEETSEKLKSTKEDLGYTTKAFGKASLERDENQYIVESHVKTEEKLSFQAQKILGLVDETVVDVSALHEKLHRKSSVQKANEQRCINLSSAFHHQLNKLEDVVNNAVHEQDDYLHSLDDSVASLGKQLEQQMTTALSQFDNFVSSQNKHLGSLASQLEHQKTNRQSWAKTLEVESKKKKASDMNQSFHSIYNTLFSQVQHIMKAQTSLINEMKRELSEKVEKSNSLVKTYRSEKKAIFDKMQDEVNQFVHKKKEKLEVCEKHATNILSKNTSQMLDWEEKLVSLEQLTNSIREFGSNCKKDVDSDVLEAKELLGAIEQDDQLHNVKAYCEEADSSVKNFETQYVAHLANIKIANKDHLEESMEMCRNLESHTESIKSKVLTNSEGNTKVWEENLSDIESVINNHTDQALNDICTNVLEMQKLSSALEEENRMHISSLKTSHEEFQKQTLIQENLKKGADDVLTSLSKDLSSEIHQIDGILEKFVTEDLLNDVPTGDTPIRKDYDYPHELAATSPYERLCQRFRDSANGEHPHFELPVEMSLESEEDNSKNNSEASQHSDAMDVLNSSFASDDSCMSEKSTDSLSFKSEIALRKGHRKENVTASKRPTCTSQKISKMKVTKIAPVSRRPFTPAN